MKFKGTQDHVAKALGMPLLQWHIKSTTKAQQALHEYDAVSRLREIDRMAFQVDFPDLKQNLLAAALLKTEQNTSLFEKLAFLQRQRR